MTVELPFEYATQVTVKATGQVATVTDYLINGNTEVKIAFWDKGQRKQEWVREYEIERAAEVKVAGTCGFKGTENNSPETPTPPTDKNGQ